VGIFLILNPMSNAFSQKNPPWFSIGQGMEELIGKDRQG
jgi:hypothetical protein